MNIEAMLTEQLQRLFSDRIDRDAWVHAEEGRLDPSLWRDVQDMGITLAMCREELGGAGLGWAACEAACACSERTPVRHRSARLC
ncbi:acyl-CoA dehydrogenase family protein [Pseudomonas nitroreducens]|uniref:acyl-CoA dehydrogenase family protein n=1 Tax=Pseudomonas nitroreducens TaxID=46680 RepID=UPI001C27C4A0